MDTARYIVDGRHRLNGEVWVHGAKMRHFLSWRLHYCAMAVRFKIVRIYPIFMLQKIFAASGMQDPLGNGYKRTKGVVGKTDWTFCMGYPR